MQGVEQSLDKVDRSAKRLNGTMQSAGLQTGRLGNQFAGLAGQIAGVHPVVGNLAGVLGNFAIGAGLTVGILAGVAAIAVVYDRLTKAAREAKEANDKLVKSLQDANFRSSLGPEPDLVLQTNAQRNELMQQKQRKRVLESFGGAAAGPKAAAELLTLNAQILHSQTQLTLGEERLFAARMAAGKGLADVMIKGGAETSKVTAKVKELAFSLEDLRKNADEFWGPMNRLNAVFGATPDLVGDLTPGAVDISDSVKIANNQAKQINDKAERNAQMIHDAVWGSAAALANSIVSSLNIGGGGKGSNLGGAIGSTAGFALGMTLTGGSPVGGAIGSLIGNIGGSFIGGLFDHKKAIETNTNAVRQNTAALLLNSPSGYKTASGRFSATDVKELKRVIPSYNSRGGAVASI